MQDEVEWEVIVEDGKKEYEVYLGIEDEEWDCTCGAKDMPLCAYPVPVAIAKKNKTLKTRRRPNSDQGMLVFVLFFSVVMMG